jgi:hypothetical protein
MAKTRSWTGTPRPKAATTAAAKPPPATIRKIRFRDRTSAVPAASASASHRSHGLSPRSTFASLQDLSR